MPDQSRPKMFRLTIGNLAWLVAYCAMLVTITLGLVRYRSAALKTYGTPDAASNWRQWRDATQDLGRAGPVERDVPQSSEPPALVLMRDHFRACLGISLLLSSCLFVSLMFTIRGAMRPVTRPIEDAA